MRTEQEVLIFLKDQYSLLDASTEWYYSVRQKLGDTSQMSAGEVKELNDELSKAECSMKFSKAIVDTLKWVLENKH